jgi:hypothetical protein
MVPDAEGADIEEFQRLILIDLNFEAFRVLGEEIGEEKAREIFKPHMLNSAMALILNSQKYLGFAISDLNSMIAIISFIGQAIWRAPPGRMILTAKGIEWHHSERCYLSGAPVSLRRMICDDAGAGFLTAGQGYGAINMCFDKGDSECGNVIFNVADPSIDWKNNGCEDAPIVLPVFDEEKKRQFGILALGELWLFPTQALMEWKGTDAITELEDAMRPLGRKWGGELARVTAESGKDLSSLLSIFDTYNTIMGQEGRTVYTSTNKHETEITICPFSVAPAEMGAQCGEAIGSQCEAFCNGICEAVNPDFELLFTSKMCAGGQCCHRVIRKKLSARVITD